MNLRDQILHARGCARRAHLDDQHIAAIIAAIIRRPEGLMWTIGSKTDIATYVAKANPGGVHSDETISAALVKAIQDTDHPPYGADWTAWLEERVDGLVVEVMAAHADTTPAPTLYWVHRYDNGVQLDGTASAELVRRSLASGQTGAVPAYRDEDSVWQYVEPAMRETHRAKLGHDVLHVYVEPAG